jgi:hypothetical protein
VRIASKESRSGETDLSKELDEVAESLDVCSDGGTGCVRPFRKS